MRRLHRAIPNGGVLIVGGVTLCLLVIAIVQTARSSSSLPQPTIQHAVEGDTVKSKAEAATPTRLKPVYETIGGMQAAWLVPSQQPPQGVFMLFHGCNRHHTDWFNYPEEQRILHLLLSRDLAVIALQQTTGACWSPSIHEKDNPDLRLAKAATIELLDRLHLKGLPIYALGASSGGSFSMIYLTVMPVQGVVVQVSPGVPDAVALWLPPQKRSKPTAVSFLYMAKDTRWASASNIAKTQGVLEGKGHPVQVLKAEGPNLHSAFFSDRMEGHITPQESSLLFTTLLDGGFLRCENGGDKCKLTSDPRMSGVLEVLVSAKVDPGVSVIVKQYRDYLEELLNVAWNSHEITSEKMGEWLEFVAQ